MYTIEEIAKVIVGEWELSNPLSEVDTLLQDSRKIEHPRTSIFFAIEGQRLDGHDYIQAMYDKGVRNFVVQKESAVANLAEVNYVAVSNSLAAMQKLAGFHRQQFTIPVIGITGSNGKTIVKEWCHQLLQEEYNICRSPKSYNSQLGVPLSVWGMSTQNDLAIFEAGVSQADEMDLLEKIIKPTIGIFTNIGTAHSENFINESHKVKEKLKLFLKAEVLIFNSDQVSLNHDIRGVFGNKSDENNGPQLLGWGKREESGIQIISEERSGLDTVLKLTYKEEPFNITIPFNDASSIENAMHCVALMMYLGVRVVEINKRLKRLQRVAMRLEQKNGVNNSILINDSYNSDLDSLKIALEFSQQQNQDQSKTLILSDILQSGMVGVDLYSSVNELLILNKIDKFIAIGENLKQHQYLFKPEHFENGVYFYNNTSEFIHSIHDEDFDNETILLKGARKFEFERISEALEEKAHATVLEIDLNAVLQNLKIYHAKLKPNTKLMVMVKAFSYGASSVEIAKFLEFHRVDYLGVAYADEGVTLRKSGVKLPILVLNPEERSLQTLIKYELEPEIYNFELLEKFASAVDRSKFEGKYPIHLDIDTGMKRLGFEENQIQELQEKIRNQHSFTVKSIFSHLAASDEKEFDDFTNEQITLFQKLSNTLCEVIEPKPLLHIANSSGINRFPSAHFDMVRLGIGLYGFSEDPSLQLATVTKLKTRISQVKTVPKGESIGYGRKGKATKEIKIATIAIGYADGMNRLLSNGVGEVFLHGKRAKVIGNVCMDMTMIDITDIPEATEGDVVEIFGDNISVTELADKLNTIPYEVLTSISERVKRVFFVD